MRRKFKSLREPRHAQHRDCGCKDSKSVDCVRKNDQRMKENPLKLDSAPKMNNNENRIELMPKDVSGSRKEATCSNNTHVCDVFEVHLGGRKRKERTARSSRSKLSASNLILYRVGSHNPKTRPTFHDVVKHLEASKTKSL